MNKGTPTNCLRHPVKNQRAPKLEQRTADKSQDLRHSKRVVNRTQNDPRCKILFADMASSDMEIAAAGGGSQTSEIFFLSADELDVAFAAMEGLYDSVFELKPDDDYVSMVVVTTRRSLSQPRTVGRSS